MTTVALLTQTYPYPSGEQFLEEEIGQWALRPDVDLVLLPLAASGVPRPLPSNVRVDLSLTQSSTPWRRTLALGTALTSSIFRKEIGRLVRSGRRESYCYAKALHATAAVMATYGALRRRTEGVGRFDFVYCYWNDIQSFAAALLKRHGLVKHLVSRIHGFDVYPEQRRQRYLPLQWQFVNEFDRIFAVSNDGAACLRETYGLDETTVQVSRMGVAVPGICTAVSSDMVLRIVSVAFCMQYKRIDRIIDALKILVTRYPDRRVSWVHIGDGDLLQDLMRHAQDQLPPGLVQWTFLGQLDNAAVKRYFATQPVDLFINTSIHEGVPVSIMEAMSYGIPVIAPDVGAVRELVSDTVGTLLDDDPSPEDIAEAIHAIAPKLRSDRLRHAARDLIASQYNASVNYQAFIQQLLAVGPVPVIALPAADVDHRSALAVSERGT